MEEIEEIKREWFDITVHSPYEKKRKALEIISIHLYSMIVGNLKKFDHNLFRALGTHGTHKTDGPYIYIDNDRSQWKRRTEKLGSLREINPMAEICKFPLRIAQRILLLRTNNPANGGNTLGSSIYKLARTVYTPAMKNGDVFTRTEKSTIDENIDYIANMIDECVWRHGVENVFIPEPWPQPEQYGTISNALKTLRGPSL